MILLFALVGTAIGEDWSHFRLPEVAKPSHYEVDLKPYLDPDDQGESYNGFEFYILFLIL